MSNHASAGHVAQAAARVSDDLRNLMTSPEVQELIALTSPRAFGGLPRIQPPLTCVDSESEPLQSNMQDQHSSTVERHASAPASSHANIQRDELARAVVARITPHLVAAGRWMAMAELRALARIESDRDLLLCTSAVARALAERDEALAEADAMRRQSETPKVDFSVIDASVGGARPLP